MLSMCPVPQQVACQLLACVDARLGLARRLLQKSSPWQKKSLAFSRSPCYLKTMNNTTNTLAKLIAQAKATFAADYRAGAIAQWNIDNLGMTDERLQRLNEEVEVGGENVLCTKDMAFWLGCLENDLPAPVLGAFSLPSL